MLRSTTLRNSSKMADALKNWLDLLFGHAEDHANVQCPSGGTISRARPKVDVGLMLMRRKFWSENWMKTSIQLGYLTNEISECLFHSPPLPLPHTNSKFMVVSRFPSSNSKAMIPLQCRKNSWRLRSILSRLEPQLDIADRHHIYCKILQVSPKAQQLKYKFHESTHMCPRQQLNAEYAVLAQLAPNLFRWWWHHRW